MVGEAHVINRIPSPSVTKASTSGQARIWPFPRAIYNIGGVLSITSEFFWPIGDGITMLELFDKYNARCFLAMHNY